MSTVVNRAHPEPAHATGHVDACWTLEALRAVWEHQRDRVHDRIDVVDHAVAALTNDDDLDASTRREAERAAHMLAGSLGMFGFIDASDAARSLEVELAHPTPGRARELSALVRRMRDGVRGPVRPVCDVPTSACRDIDDSLRLAHAYGLRC